MTSRLHWVFLTKGIAFLIFCIWAGTAIDFQLEKIMYALQHRADHVSYVLFRLGNGIEKIFILIGAIICAVYFTAYFTTVIALTTKRLMMRQGFLFVKLVNVDLEEIKGEYVDHGFLGRFFNYGEIRMDARFVENFYVPNIANPYRLLRAINEARATAGDTVIAGEVPLQPVETVAAPPPQPTQPTEKVVVVTTPQPATAPQTAAVTAQAITPPPTAPAPAAPGSIVTVRAGDLPPDMPVAVPEAQIPEAQAPEAQAITMTTKPAPVEPSIAPEPLAAAMDGLQSAIETFTDIAKPPEQDGKKS